MNVCMYVCMNVGMYVCVCVCVCVCLFVCVIVSVRQTCVHLMNGAQNLVLAFLCVNEVTSLVAPVRERRCLRTCICKHMYILCVCIYLVCPVCLVCLISQ